MNKYTLYESFGSLDDDILERSEKRGKRVFPGGSCRWGAVAACACLAVAAALSAREFLAPDTRSDVGGLAGQPIDATACDVPGLDGATAPSASGDGLVADVGVIAPGNGLVADVDVTVPDVPSGVPVPGGAMPEPNVPIPGGATTAPGQESMEEARPGSHFSAEVSDGMTEPGSGDNVAGGKVEGCLTDDRERLTLQEALNVETIGKYLLAEGPEGFAAEAVSYRRREGGGSLYAVWCRTGTYDEVDWRVSLYTEADAGRVTAAADTRNYDLSLYPIPRAESVPEELRQIVDHPIFSIDELTQEVVNRRAYCANDSGDTGGVRMNFGVLYGEVLVEVNAKGVSPEWLYEQLSALK